LSELEKENAMRIARIERWKNKKELQRSSN